MKKFLMFILTVVTISYCFGQTSFNIPVPGGLGNIDTITFKIDDESLNHLRNSKEFFIDDSIKYFKMDSIESQKKGITLTNYMDATIFLYVYMSNSYMKSAMKNSLTYKMLQSDMNYIRFTNDMSFIYVFFPVQAQNIIGNTLIKQGCVLIKIDKKSKSETYEPIILD